VHRRTTYLSLFFNQSFKGTTPSRATQEQKHHEAPFDSFRRPHNSEALAIERKLETSEPKVSESSLNLSGRRIVELSVLTSYTLSLTTKD
jgi:hypothetical protein